MYKELCRTLILPHGSRRNRKASNIVIFILQLMVKVGQNRAEDNEVKRDDSCEKPGMHSAYAHNRGQ